jgi:hypothetical protein
MYPRRAVSHQRKIEERQNKKKKKPNFSTQTKKIGQKEMLESIEAQHPPRENLRTLRKKKKILKTTESARTITTKSSRVRRTLLHLIIWRQMQVDTIHIVTFAKLGEEITFRHLG